MKKLLISTAIVGAVAFAPAANAGDLQVNVGGFLDFQAAHTSDDAIGDSALRPDANEINFGTDSEINFTVNGKADNGLEYGAVIELEAQVGQEDERGGAGSSSGHADKAYLFAQGGWGRVEAGNNTDASEALSVNTGGFASATGGIDGDFYRYTVAPAGSNIGFITRPDLPTAFSGSSSTHTDFSNAGVTGQNEDATKITYYTPRVSGFQAGVSYAPNSEDVGTVPNLANTGYENLFAGGVNYAGELSGVGVKAAITGQTADNKTSGSQDLEAYDLGASLSYAGFTLGASYGDWSDTLGVSTDADFWDLGLGYATGPYSISATYFNSQTKTAAGAKDDFDNFVVGADYKAAPGLVPYVEASFFDYNSTGTGITNDNDGTVVIVGSKLTF